MAECGLQEEEEDFLPDVEDNDNEPIEEDFLPDVEDSDDEPMGDFPANFKKHMERELKYSRLEISDKPPGSKSRSSYTWEGIRWVFWNPQDDDQSYDHSVDFNPDDSASRKARLDVRLALRKLILHPELTNSLVQFWARTKTREGRTLLTTQFQPFAIGRVDFRTARHWLCEYRMGMCREYNNYFYADAESEEEQLGLLGRVFLNKLPESTPYVKHYTLKEYPQRDLALRCEIEGSWAVPVFEHSSHTCVGVLEFVSAFNMCDDWFDKQFRGSMCDIFQEFGLLCFDGYKHYKMQNGDKNKALTAAFQELEMVCESVCKIHNLPLALAWASCHSCDDLLQSQYQVSTLEYGYDINRENVHIYSLRDFVNVSRYYHLRKGQVTERILQHPNLLYCSDVKQFSIAESPLVPYARLCEFSGWFTMCLQGSYTGDELYVLELFLPKSDENDENVLTKLRLILGTMQEYFETFKLASGQELREVLYVEVIDFHNGEKIHSIQKIPATRSIPSLELLEDGGVILQQGHLDQPSMDPSSNGQIFVTAERNILVASSSREGKRKMRDREHKKAGVRIEVPLEEILKCSNMKRNSAARKLNVSPSTFKRLCRVYDIPRWPPRNIENANPFRPLPVENQGQIPQLNSDLPSNQALAGVSHIKPGFQDANMVTIRAKYENNKIKFRLPLTTRFVELQEQVAKRLNLEAGTYYVKYKDEEDEEGGLTLITCNEDLQDCMHTSRSLGKASVVVLLELKQPITNLNPGLSGGQHTLFSPLRSQGLQSAEGEPCIVPIMHTRGGVWLDAHFSYTPTVDEEETINKCMQDGSFRGEFVDGCWISNTTVMEYSEMLDHYLSHCHFFGPNVINNFKQNGRLLNTILLPKTEKIFFPILRDRHWMLLVIDVKKKCFLWLDSMRCEREKKYSEVFAHFLNHEFVFKRLREQNEWPIKYPENTPIQENGNDCGVYVMAFMISLAVGDKLPQFSQAQAKRMRKTICLELKKRDIIPQCPLVDYKFLYIQERKEKEALNEKLRMESTAALRDEVLLVSETSSKVRGSSS